MEVKDGILVLRADEVDQGSCPINPKWGASQVSAYPLDVVVKSEKLAPLLLCSKVLEMANISFRIVPGEIHGDDPPAASTPAAEDLAASGELVQAEAEEPTLQ